MALQTFNILQLGAKFLVAMMAKTSEEEGEGLHQPEDANEQAVANAGANKADETVNKVLAIPVEAPQEEVKAGAPELALSAQQGWCAFEAVSPDGTIMAKLYKSGLMGYPMNRHSWLDCLCWPAGVMVKHATRHALQRLRMPMRWSWTQATSVSYSAGQEVMDLQTKKISGVDSNDDGVKNDAVVIIDNDKLIHWCFHRYGFSHWAS